MRLNYYRCWFIAGFCFSVRVVRCSGHINYYRKHWSFSGNCTALQLPTWCNLMNNNHDSCGLTEVRTFLLKWIPLPRKRNTKPTQFRNGKFVRICMSQYELCCIYTINLLDVPGWCLLFNPFNFMHILLKSILR